ncbi:MAG: hypothetical protein ACFFCM_14605, partial [Promethearchaeota archaeon]
DLKEYKPDLKEYKPEIKEVNDFINNMKKLKENSIPINKIDEFKLRTIPNLDKIKLNVLSKEIKERIEKLRCSSEDKIKIIREIAKLPKDLQKEFILKLAELENS